MAALVLGSALLGAPAAAQAPAFSCFGAERLEDDVFSVPFARGGSTIGRDAASALAAAVEQAKAQPERRICVLGHASDDGGAGTNVRLAARRAGAVEELVRRGIPRARIRGEARAPAFAPGTPIPSRRDATVVLLP
jgi:outer membrane protein OmpA-like peptidoglycan-associated protein